MVFVYLKRLLGRIDFLFICLVLGVFLINTPYLNLSLIPRHDTMFGFQIFYFFYNEFFFHHTIAQWMPYGAHGIPAGVYQAGVLTPAEYFLGFLGALLGVKNVLFLFNAAIMLEQITFLGGMYLLAKLLLGRKMVIALVCIAAFCSMGWQYQLFFNLRMGELFPFVLYFLFLFFERRKAAYFWMAGVISIFWALGSWFYFSFLWFFLCSVICAVLFACHRGAWKKIWPDSKFDAAVMMFFFFLAALYSLFCKYSFDHIAVIGRENGVANSLQTFLKHGNDTSFNILVNGFFLGTPPYLPLGSGVDNTCYMGFITIILFVWAIGFVRDKYFLAIMAGFVALVWLSFGGIIATLVYYFPMMEFYRHVGLVFSLVKVCVALGAGFGLTDFLKCPGEVRMKRLLLTLGICLLLVDTNLHFNFDSNFIDNTHRFVFFQSMYLKVFALCAAFYILSMIRRKNGTPMVLTKSYENVFTMVLIGALCLDVVFFQVALYKQISPLPNQDLIRLKSVEVNKLPFIMQRGQRSFGQQTNLLIKDDYLEGYESVYAPTKSEPCNAIPMRDISTINVKGFYDTKIQDSAVEDRISGCHAPKLRLLTSERSFSNTKDMRDYMQSASQFDGVALLNVSQKEGPIPKIIKDQVSNDAGNIVVKDFTANGLGLLVDVKKNGGAWLVYADSFHPGWHADIDGVSTKVYDAYIAFKAVFVPEGRHSVQFVFFDGWGSVLSYIIALFGLVAGFGVFFLLVRMLFL